jgi:hypothetical protein
MAYGEFSDNSGAPIAEQQYGVADQITTTHVDSCIVVVAPAGSKLFGIHLVLFGSGGDVFGADAAGKVIEIMRNAGADTTNVTIFGEPATWEQNGIEGYLELKRQLTVRREVEQRGSLNITSQDL